MVEQKIKFSRMLLLKQLQRREVYCIYIFLSLSRKTGFSCSWQKKDLPDFRVGVAAREVAKAKKVGLLKTEPLANIVHAIAA